MTQPSAIVVTDSVGPAGVRLTTLEVVMHRFVLAEFNTHRAFSRNSASSRAIPYGKQRERVLQDPAVPLSWPAEQKGMQGGEEVGEGDALLAEYAWLKARDHAIRSADVLSMTASVHKSVVNRLLEPFMWHTVVVTATDWTGFFEQRCSPLAQPEIRVAAEAMRAALASSTPEFVDYGGYHLPYLTEEDAHECYRRRIDPRQVSAARCARVSYLTHDGRRDLAADVELYERLVSARPAHASPLEHVARPTDYETGERHTRGNFRGWRQLRSEIGL